MMKKKDFIKKVIRELPGYLPEDLREDLRISEMTATRMNDRKLHGIVLRRKSQQAAPTIYLDEMYEKFRQGEPFESLLFELAATYVRGERMNKEPLMRMPPEDPDSCVTLLALRLLSIERNREYLREGPYRDVGNGLALTCDFRVWDERTGEWRMRITNDWMKRIGLNEAQLFQDAFHSCSVGNPATLYDLEDRCSAAEPVNLLEPGIPETLPAEQKGRSYVLSTRHYKLGAAGLFYPGVMDRIGRLLEEDYYVVPTSVHEVLIIPDSAGLPPEQLEELLSYGNRTVVEPEDILSDDLYHFDHERGELRLSGALRTVS